MDLVSVDFDQLAGGHQSMAGMQTHLMLGLHIHAAPTPTLLFFSQTKYVIAHLGQAIRHGFLNPRQNPQCARRQAHFPAGLAQMATCLQSQVCLGLDMHTTLCSLHMQALLGDQMQSPALGPLQHGEQCQTTLGRHDMLALDDEALLARGRGRHRDGA